MWKYEYDDIFIIFIRISARGKTSDWILGVARIYIFPEDVVQNGSVNTPDFANPSGNLAVPLLIFMRPQPQMLFMFHRL